MLIADHFPKLARGQRRDRESDPEPEKSPPPTPGPVTRSSEPAPGTLRPERKLWVKTLSQPRETCGSVSPPGRRRNLGFSTRGQFSRARPSGPAPHSPSRAPGRTLWNPQLGLVVYFEPDPNGQLAHTLGQISGSSHGDTRLAHRGLLSYECAGSAWLGGASGDPPEAGDANCLPAGAKRAPGPTLVPIWFPHWPAWMCTISLMAGASALRRCLSRLRSD